MFILCVLYNKGQKSKPGQSGQRSTERGKKKLPVGVNAIFFIDFILYAAFWPWGRLSL
jgi:hypothetical protein